MYEAELMANDKDKIIRKSYRLPASREAVFGAWISNDYAIPPVSKIVVEPKVGGAFRLEMSKETGGGVMAGCVLVFQPGELIRYTWQWQGSAENSTVDVRFFDDGNATLVKLAHTGLDTIESVRQHANGWDAYIKGLTHLLNQQEI